MLRSGRATFGFRTPVTRCQQPCRRDVTHPVTGLLHPSVTLTTTIASRRATGFPHSPTAGGQPDICRGASDCRIRDTGECLGCSLARQEQVGRPCSLLLHSPIWTRLSTFPSLLGNADDENTLSQPLAVRKIRQFKLLLGMLVA